MSVNKWLVFVSALVRLNPLLEPSLGSSIWGLDYLLALSWLGEGVPSGSPLSASKDLGYPEDAVILR